MGFPLGCMETDSSVTAPLTAAAGIERGVVMPDLSIIVAALIG